MLPAVGWTTASANAVATAASTAVPPSLIASAPMREAISFCEAAMPSFARIGTDPARSVMETTAQATATISNRVLLMAGRLYALRFPAAASEDDDAQHREQRKRKGERQEETLRSDAEGPRQHVGERDLKQPKTEEVEHRRRERVARAVERRRQHHPVRVEHEAGADDAQATDGVRHDGRVGGERRDQQRREYDKDHADAAEEDHVE